MTKLMKVLSSMVGSDATAHNTKINASREGATRRRPFDESWSPQQKTRQTRSQRSHGRNNGYFLQPRKPPSVKNLDDSAQTLDDSTQSRRHVSFLEEVEIVEYQEDFPAISFEWKNRDEAETPAPTEESIGPIPFADDEGMYFM